MADVIAAVRFARETGLPVAVRGGGHSFPGLSVCDGGIVIDLSPMKGIRVDPQARTARAQAGVLLGELDRETQAFGLAASAGIVTHTGIAGLTLGGGIGWLMRKHGLTVDQLVAVDLVTAEGEFVKASETENPDCSGACGAAAATSASSPSSSSASIRWARRCSPGRSSGRCRITEGPSLLSRLDRRRPRRADDDRDPPQGAGASVRPASSRRAGGHVVCCYAGSPRTARVVQPLKRFGSPVLDLCAPKPFLDHQAMFDPSFPHGWWYYFRSCDVAELTDDVIDITVDHAMRIESPLTNFPIWQMGGAVSRVGEDETAFNGRGVGHTFNIAAATETAEGFDEEREWVRNFWSALEPHHTSVT